MAKKVRVLVIRVPREKVVVPVGTTPRGLKDFAILESAFPAPGIGVAIMLNRVCVVERCLSQENFSNYYGAPEW